MTVEPALDDAQAASSDPTLIQEVQGQTSTTLRIFALGLTHVYRGEQALTSADWIYTKVKELLLYLLCHRSRTKEQISLVFWPDASPAQLRSSFHDTLYHLRRTLGRPDWIVFEHGQYAFNRQLPYWFDVEAYESCLTLAHTLQEKTPKQAIQVLEQAVTLYQGDFLDDMGTSDWYFERRAALQGMYRDALLTLGRLHFSEGSYAQAAAVYRQALAHDNYLEGAHRELMRCYVHQGERSQALRHYQTFLEWIHDELGTQPSPETTALFERLRCGLDG